FTNATDAADYLVGKGIPFRDAHGIVGRLVLFCLDKNISLDEMTLDEYCNSVGEIYDIVIEDMIRQSSGLHG
nr:hypothetical protein [Lachnospiraceae bacterium]